MAAAALFPYISLGINADHLSPAVIALMILVAWAPPFFTATYASSKGYRFPLFFFVGLFSFVAAFLIALFLPSRAGNEAPA